MSVIPEASSPQPDRENYLQAVAHFDRLWSQGSSARDQSEMARLLQLIEAYEKDRL